MFRVFIFFTVGIILFDYIAGFTRDEKYSGSIINEISQVVFMDERTNDLDLKSELDLKSL